MVGNPAKQIGWASVCGEKLTEDLDCTACGNHYKMSEKGLSIKLKP